MKGSPPRAPFLFWGAAQELLIQRRTDQQTLRGRNRHAGCRDLAAVAAIDLAGGLRHGIQQADPEDLRSVPGLPIACESAPVEQVGMTRRPDLAVGIQTELLRRRSQGEG